MNATHCLRHEALYQQAQSSDRAIKRQTTVGMSGSRVAAMPLSRRAFNFGLLSLPLAGCGGKVPTELWLNHQDLDDRIEIISSSAARITALFGQPIDLWHRTGTAPSEFGRTLADAERQLAQYETVQVVYDYVEAEDTLTFRSESRGSRPMFFARSDMMFDRLVSDRSFLLEKT